MAAPRNALGRGLGALLPSSSTKPLPPPPVPALEVHETGFREIAVERIDPNPEQPRRHFDEAHLQELVQSVKRHGVLQPVVVRRAGERYELIVGERRWRASRAAGRETVPAVVSDVDDRDCLELAIVENVQRQDLNPIELAQAYRALSENGATQEEIGTRVGLERSSVANHLRLLELSSEIQTDVEAGRLSMGHAKALLQERDPERRQQLRDQIVEGKLSVRDAEQVARGKTGPSAPRKSNKARSTVDPTLQQLVEILQKQLQTRIRLRGNTERGRIEIEYFGKEDLNRISRILLEGP